MESAMTRGCDLFVRMRSNNRRSHAALILFLRLADEEIRVVEASVARE